MLVYNMDLLWVRDDSSTKPGPHDKESLAATPEPAILHNHNQIIALLNLICRAGRASATRLSQ